jgi:hypothetical protein
MGHDWKRGKRFKDRRYRWECNVCGTVEVFFGKPSPDWKTSRNVHSISPITKKGEYIGHPIVWVYDQNNLETCEESTVACVNED